MHSLPQTRTWREMAPQPPTEAKTDTGRDSDPGIVAERAAFFHALSETHRGPLERFFKRRSCTRDEAEDLVQEVFLRLIRRLDEEPIENAEAFLFRTAVNLLRDRARRGATVANNSTELQERQQKFEALSPERVLEGKQRLQVILKALDTFDTRSKDIFILNRLEGMKYAEIARIYGLSVSSIEKSVTRVFAQLLKRDDRFQGKSSQR
jgi:RNA polymerase sigma factor (sigma-70 family)